jgi:hypothetical protein
MTSIRLLLAALIAASASSTAFAQDYFDFGTIPGVPTEPSVEVDLNSAMLSFVTQAAEASGTDTAGALDGLKNVRVRVYEDLKDANAVAAFMDESSRALDRAGWQRAVYVAEDESKVRMYVKMKDQNISGMTFMVLDGEEAVFINIEGTIDPAQLGRLASMMGVGDVMGAFGGNGRGAGQQRSGRQPSTQPSTGRQLPPDIDPPQQLDDGAAEAPNSSNAPEATRDSEPTQP